jgi:hypothetical protein
MKSGERPPPSRSNIGATRSRICGATPCIEKIVLTSALDPNSIQVRWNSNIYQFGKKGAFTTPGSPKKIWDYYPLCRRLGRALHLPPLFFQENYPRGFDFCAVAATGGASRDYRQKSLNRSGVNSV